jgi:hypothetical protein
MSYREWRSTTTIGIAVLAFLFVIGCGMRRLEGTVVGVNSQPIPNCAVTLEAGTNGGLRLSRTTNETGKFSFGSVSTFGGCAIRLEKPGYESQEVRCPVDGSPVRAMMTLTGTDVSKIYNPVAMIEVKNFADLPDGVQTLANESFMKGRYDGTPTKFLIGGASKSSAVVAYEQFGYVPSFFAQSYILSNSRWVEAKRWQLDAEIISLRDLILFTSSIQ